MHFCVFYYVRSIFVQHASVVLQCNPDVIFPSVILCWINLSWVLSPESWPSCLGLNVFSRMYVIQIKICAEYRDMLPRPRLVCQEPGLRPIGRSPGVPDKSSRGLGSMSRYSAQILICFIAYIFLFFFHSSVGLVGNFAGLPVCTVPSAIVHCNQNEAGHQTIKAPSMPCWGAAGPSKHSLAFKVTAWWEWQITWMKSVSIVSFQHKNHTCE